MFQDELTSYLWFQEQHKIPVGPIYIPSLCPVVNSEMDSDAGCSKETIQDIPWNSLNSQFVKVIGGKSGTLPAILASNSERIPEN